MECIARMVNGSTGEVLYTRKLGYVFNISCKVESDAGRREIDKIVQSALRGARQLSDSIVLNLEFKHGVPFTANLPFSGAK